MKNIITWILKLISAAILLQTLFFKFTGAPESIYIFSSLGLEPWGRWGSGVSELIASILLLVPATDYIGAALGLAIMAGALASHLLVLGIVVQNDDGLLFGLACVVFVCCSLILSFRRRQILLLIKKLQHRDPPR